MGVIRPEVIATQKRSATFLDYLAQANQSISQLGSFLNQQKALQLQERKQFADERATTVRNTLGIISELAGDKPNGFMQVAQQSPTLLKLAFKNMGMTDTQISQTIKNIQDQQLDLKALTEIGITNYDQARQAGKDPSDSLQVSQKAWQTDYLKQSNERTQAPVAQQASLNQPQQKPISDKDFIIPAVRHKVTDISDSERTLATNVLKQLNDKIMTSKTGTSVLPMTTDKFRNEFINEFIKARSGEGSPYNIEQTAKTGMTKERAGLIYNTLIGDQAATLTKPNNVGPLTNETKFVPGISAPVPPTNGQMDSQLLPGASMDSPTPTYTPPNAVSQQVAPSAANPPSPVSPLLSPSPVFSPPPGIADAISQSTNPEFNLDKTKVPTNILSGVDLTKLSKTNQGMVIKVGNWIANPKDKKLAYKGKIAVNQLAKVLTPTAVRTKTRQEAAKVIKNLGGLDKAIEFANVPYGELQRAKKATDSLIKYRAWQKTVVSQANTGKDTGYSKDMMTLFGLFDKRVETAAEIKDPKQREAAVKLLFNDNEPLYSIIKANAKQSGIDMDLWKNALLKKKDVGFFTKLWRSFVGGGNISTQPPVNQTEVNQTEVNQYMETHGLTQGK